MNGINQAGWVLFMQERTAGSIIKSSAGFIYPQEVGRAFGFGMKNMGGGGRMKEFSLMRTNTRPL